MGAREELQRKVTGLDERLLGDFFTALLNGAGRIETVEALYHDYVDFCLARCAAPGSLGAFTEVFNRLMAKIRTEIPLQ